MQEVRDACKENKCGAYIARARRIMLAFFVIIGYNNAAAKKTPPASHGPCYHP